MTLGQNSLAYSYWVIDIDTIGMDSSIIDAEIFPRQNFYNAEYIITVQLNHRSGKSF